MSTRQIDSQAEKQIRLGLEAECSRAFGKLVDVEALRCPVTLLAFDFGGGPGEKFSNVAFKTSLPVAVLVETVEALLASWASGRPRVVDARQARLLGLPDGETVVRCATLAKQLLRGGALGFSLIFGQGETASYVSNAVREDVADLLRNDCLPHWRKEAGLV